MVKKMTMVLLSTLLGTVLYAGNYDTNTKGFLGLEVGYGSINADRLDGKHTGNAIEYGLHFGAQSNEWRETFSFDYFNSDSDDQKAEKGYLLVDYFFLQNDSELNVRPFIGLNVGFLNYESTQVAATGFIYGGQAGVVVGVGENVDLDLSYRYSLSASNQVNDMGTIIFGSNYLY